MFGVNHNDTGTDYAYAQPTAGHMLMNIGTNSALFMLFNPLTNTHYLMIQLANYSVANSGATKFDIFLPYVTDPNNSASSYSIENGDLGANTALITGQTIIGDWA